MSDKPKGEFIVPRCFLIGETRTIPEGLQAALEALGVGDWKTDAFSDTEHLMEFAGKGCYMSFDTKLNKNLTRVGTRNNQQYLQEQIIGVKHGSVLEHCVVNAFFHNVSRVFTHELVRHRPGTAFSQVSGRYVRNDKIDMYLPDCIAHTPPAIRVFERAQLQMEENIAELEAIFGINEMKNFGRKKELTSAFRRLIGNGQGNHITFSANHRSLRYEIQARTALGAEEEIRMGFLDMFEQVSKRYPAIYADATLVQAPNSHLPFVQFEHEKV